METLLEVIKTSSSSIDMTNLELAILLRDNADAGIDPPFWKADGSQLTAKEISEEIEYIISHLERG